MKPCIYGDQTYSEGATICVNGRELLCVLGEWTETGHACTEPSGDVGATGAGQPPRQSAARGDDDDDQR